MAYIKTDWVDNQTAITAARMNNIEDGIANNETAITQVETRIGTLSGIGQPIIATSADAMTDTDKIYLYVGSEEGYETGHWYYYDTEWVDGGEYGSSVTGISNNARNLLKYILERVAYTETGMDVYVNALYEALAQSGGGGGTTTYMIINALTNVTNSNSATGCDEGDSYTATLTADEGYSIDTVTVTMGGVDVTSTVYNSSTSVITIAEVTGDIVITATSSSFMYVLNSSFVSSGTNYIDTSLQLEAGKTYTFLCDFTQTSTVTTVSYVFGTRLSSSESNYLALQVQNAYIWGMGIGYSSGNGLGGLSRYKTGIVLTVNSDGSSTATNMIRNITTAGSIQTFTNTYASGAAINGNTWRLGSSSNGFKGVILDFKIKEGAMPTADIEDYLSSEGGVELLYSLEESDFMRGEGLTDASPYYATQAKRISYVDYDLLIDGGHTYEIYATSTYNTAQLGLVAYNQNALDAVNTSTTVGGNDRLDSGGWHGLIYYYTAPLTINNSTTKGFRLTFRQSSSDPNISSDFSITGVTIKKVA